MAPRSPLLLTASVIASVIAVAGCDRKAEAAAETPVTTATAPDPAAPAPGTQAAEAIGADSSSDTPPSTQSH